MDTQKLRQRILDLAIRGKLVPQDPNDEPASVLLDRIRAEKERLIAEGKIKRPKAKKSTDKSQYQNFTPPFEIPESWQWVRLEDIAKIGTGATPSKSNRKYYGGNINWVSSSVTSSPYVYTPTDFITELALKETNCEIYPKGTLLMAMYGEGKTRGQVTELRIEAASNQACAAIIPYNPATKNYVKLYLLANYYQLRTLAEGGNQPNLNLGKISTLFIPMPPAQEQHRILEQYENILESIELVETSKISLEGHINVVKSRILDLAMQGKLVPQDPADEPAAEMLRRINPKAKIITDNPHYPQLPDNWVLVPLEDITEYEQPQPYIVQDTSYSDMYTIPVLTAGKSFILGYTNEDVGVYDNVPAIIFDDFTTDSRLVEFPFKVKSSAMKIIQVKRGLNIEYVAMFMSITRLIGETHKRYWISEYSKIALPIPPLDEQNRIAMRVKALYCELDKITTALTE